MSNAYSFPPASDSAEVWGIVNAKTAEKMAGRVLRSHSNNKFTAWLPDGGRSERPVVAATFDELSAKLDALGRVDNGLPLRARLEWRPTTCGELRRGDWVKLQRHGFFSRGWETCAREVLTIHPLNREKVAITLEKDDPQYPFEETWRPWSEACEVLYVNHDYVEWSFWPNE
jgi:hypothetical protein